MFFNHDICTSAIMRKKKQKPSFFEPGNFEVIDDASLIEWSSVLGVLRWSRLAELNELQLVSKMFATSKNPSVFNCITGRPNL